jgi:hypothetical protein
MNVSDPIYLPDTVIALQTMIKSSRFAVCNWEGAECEMRPTEWGDERRDKGKETEI